MGSVDVEAHRSILEALLKRESTRQVDLLIVSSIAEWAAQRRGTCRNDPVAMAVTDAETGHWGVLLRRTIDAAEVSSVLDRMEFGGGFAQCRSVLHSPEQFLKHTVLHELAHLTNN